MTHAGRHHPGHLHLRPVAAPGAAPAAQAPGPLRGLGRRLVGRDVPGLLQTVTAPTRPTHGRRRPGDRPVSRRPSSPRMTSATVTATSPALVGGTPNWAGRPVSSTSSTFQSLRTTTEPSVVWNAPWPSDSRSRALPELARQAVVVGVGLGRARQLLDRHCRTSPSGGRPGRRRCRSSGGRSRWASTPSPVSPRADAMSCLGLVRAHLDADR